VVPAKTWPPTAMGLPETSPSRAAYQARRIPATLRAVTAEPVAEKGLPTPPPYVVQSARGAAAGRCVTSVTTCTACCRPALTAGAAPETRRKAVSARRVAAATAGRTWMRLPA
jgi:hypothetical protein